MKKDSLNLLNNLEVIKWCYEGITDTSLKNTDNEKKLKEAIEIEDLVDDGVYYCTSCYKDLSLSDDEVIEILKSNN